MNLSPQPTRRYLPWLAADLAALWRLAGLLGAAFDAEADRLAAELERTPNAVVAAYYQHVHPHMPTLDGVPTAVLARLVAERLAA